MDLDKWKKFSGKFGHGRTDELKDVDRAVAQYQANPSLANLKTLALRVLDWQASKTDWMRTDSIRAEPMRELVNLIKQSARTAWPEVRGRIFNRLHSDLQLASLINNPMSWLSGNLLSIAGLGDGQRDFYLSVQHPDPTFEQEDIGKGFVMGIGPLNYRMDEANLWATKIQGAMCIKMHTDISSASNAAAVTNHMVALAGSVMVTGMVNGCSFLIEDAGGAGALNCTHIKPVGQASEALQNQINGFNLNHTLVYGQNDYGAALAATVIGFAKGSWQIFAQLSPRGSPAKVTRVVQLYPQ